MYYIAKVSREGSRWLAVFPAAPGCATSGESEKELAVMARDAIHAWLGSWLDAGELPPAPLPQPSEGLRVDIDPALAVAVGLRRARIDAGLTQVQVAERAGVSQQQIAKLERPRQNPSVATLAKIGAAIGVRVVVAFETLDG